MHTKNRPDAGNRSLTSGGHSGVMNAPVSLQTYPHSIEAELAVLGAILLDNSSAGALPAGFSEEAFYDPVHGRIFAHAMARIQKGALATPITIRHLMSDDEGLAALGGANYLTRIVDHPRTIGSVADYAAHVAELHRLRTIAKGADELGEAARRPDGDPGDVAARLEAVLLRAAPASRSTSFGAAWANRFDTIISAYQEGVDLTGVPTGCSHVDDRIGGYQPGDLIIAAGRPSMGKTSWMLFSALKAALGGHGVYIGSLEMTPEKISERLVSLLLWLRQRYRFPYEGFRRPSDISEEQMRAIAECSIDVADLPIHISDPSIRRTGDISGEIRRARRWCESQKVSLDLVCVDYLQLIEPAEMTRGAVERTTRAVGDLKGLALQHNVPMLALSQLSRRVEEREDKRPQLSDLRDSGAIEQDADVIMFPFSEEYYVRRAEPREGTPEHTEWMQKIEECEGVFEMIIGKQRQGPIGTVRLTAELDVGMFSNLHREVF